MRIAAGTVVAIAGVVLAAGCGSSRPAAITTTTTTTSSSGVSFASPRVQQIALARNSNALFRIFPAKAGSTNCEIPEGGVHFKPLRGTCVTSIRPAQSREPELIVSFTETWPMPKCGRGLYCPVFPTPRHTWLVRETEPIVTAGARLRVWPSEQSGTIAPQYYK
jgi:hypothetical protein